MEAIMLLDDYKHDMANIIKQEPYKEFVLQKDCSLCERKIILCKGTDFIRENSNNRLFFIQIFRFFWLLKGYCKTNVEQIFCLLHIHKPMNQLVA